MGIVDGRTGRAAQQRASDCNPWHPQDLPHAARRPSANIRRGDIRAHRCWRRVGWTTGSPGTDGLWRRPTGT
eukprot:6764706-Pyramimonas_sp.AAC.1